MRRATLAVIAITLATDSADACHRFHVWKYPWAQSCRVTALAPRSAVLFPRTRINVSFAPRPHRPVVPIPDSRFPDFPIPDLADIEWCPDAADEMRGRLLLRVILNGKEDK